MKQIRSPRNLIRTALLLVSSAAGLMAQSELASNAMPHHTIPFANLPSQTENGGIRTSRLNVASNTLFQPLVFDPASLSRPPATSATLASATANTKSSYSFISFGIQAHCLPSWEMDQPLANLKYGTVGANGSVTLHFGHKN